MSTQESENLSGKSGAGLATFVLLGTRYENVPEFGGHTILENATERIAAFPLPAHAVQAAVAAVAKAPDLRYAAVATEVFDPEDPQHAVRQVKAIAEFAQRGQIVVSLASHELARHSLPADYRFDSLGAVAVSTGSVEHLFFATHPMLAMRETRPAPRVATRRTTLFVGRERELAEIRRQMDLSRIVTVTGSAGIGKSSLLQRLITEIDTEFPDGVGKIDLSLVSQPAFIAPTLVRLLETPKLAGEEHLEALVAYLRPRRFLLVFDNAEQMIGEVRKIVTTLIDACPDLGILVGSQKSLRVAGEARYRLEGMDRPAVAEDARAMQDYDAVALFVDRAQLVDTTFLLTPENAADIAALCERLDGIPLALELAAAKTKLLSPKQILGRLNDRFLLLKDSASGKTLLATVDLGYTHLREDDQILLQRLSVFSGAFTVDQATELFADERLDEASVLAAFEELVDSSMVATSTLSGGPKRFHLTETIRLYAREKLKAAGEQAKFHQRYLQWCDRFTQKVESELTGPDQSVWLYHLDASYQDVRSAIQYHLTRKGNPAIAIRMLLAMHRYFFMRHYLSEGFRLTTMVADSPSAQKMAGIARVHNLASALANWIGDDESARKYAVQSMRIARRQKDISGLARAQNSIAFIADAAGQLPKARRHLLGAMAAFKELGEESLLLRVLLNVSIIETTMGLVDAAREHLLEGEALLAKDPEPFLRAYFHQNYAHLCLAENIPIRALKNCLDALLVLQEFPNPASTGICMRNISSAFDLMGRHSDSARYLGAAAEFERTSEQMVVQYDRDRNHALQVKLVRILGEEKALERFEEGTRLTIQDAIQELSRTLGY